jgi:hypothetical protein
MATIPPPHALPPKHNKVSTVTGKRHDKHGQLSAARHQRPNLHRGAPCRTSRPPCFHPHHTHPKSHQARPIAPWTLHDATMAGRVSGTSQLGVRDEPAGLWSAAAIARVRECVGFTQWRRQRPAGFQNATGGVPSVYGTSARFSLPHSFRTPAAPWPSLTWRPQTQGFLDHSGQVGQ